MSDSVYPSTGGPLEIQLHLPPRAEVDDWSLAGGLVALTKFLIEEHKQEWAGGLLGGEFGYGVPFATDKFMMMPFCWCESDDCPWCCGCDCEFDYFIEGKPVDEEAFYRAGGYRNGVPTLRVECDVCKTGGPAAIIGGGPNKGAPNFWHYGSGLQVRWYKWIGRDMEVEGPEGDWPLILADSFQSVGAP